MAAVDITFHCEVGGQVEGQFQGGADVESQVTVGVGADVESQVTVGVGADVESQGESGVGADVESQGESGAGDGSQFKAKTTERDLRKRVIERWRRHLPLRVRFGNVTPQTLADGSLGPGPDELTGVLFDIREKTIISPYELVGCVAVINPFNFVDKSFQYYASADALELLPKADQRFEIATVSMFLYSSYTGWKKWKETMQWRCGMRTGIGCTGSVRMRSTRANFSGVLRCVLQSHLCLFLL